MTINILGVGDESAFLFLNVAGVLDFIVAVVIFFPKKISQFALIYMVFWGFVTTLARVWANFNLDMIGDTLSLWLHESIYRVPHFLIPVAVLIWSRFVQKTRATSVT